MKSAKKYPNAKKKKGEPNLRKYFAEVAEVSRETANYKVGTPVELRSPGHPQDAITSPWHGPVARWRR